MLVDDNTVESMTTWPIITFSVLLTLAASTANSDSKTDPVNEQIASLIADIDSHVKWPDAKTDMDKPFFVAMLGKSSLTTRIKELNRTKLPDGREIKVRFVRAELLPSNAHILVVAAADDKLSARQLEKLKGTGTLTVTAGAIDLPIILRVDQVEIGGKTEVRMSLDLKLAAAEHLEVTQKLKKLAVTTDIEDMTKR